MLDLFSALAALLLHKDTYHYHRIYVDNLEGMTCDTAP
jgi:hypothetical protein